MMQQVGGQPQQAQSFPKPKQQVSAQTSPSGVSLGAGNSASSQSHIQWPRMTQNDAQKYSNIFVKVDTDRDGKITGEQARDLFLKWGLPRGGTSFVKFIFCLVIYKAQFLLLC